MIIIRDTNNKIVWGDEKVCIILYNGTKYPDLVCIFLEDAEKVERKGPRSFSDILSTYGKTLKGSSIYF
jgi:hypothetical protein